LPFQAAPQAVQTQTNGQFLRLKVCSGKSKIAASAKQAEDMMTKETRYIVARAQLLLAKVRFSKEVWWLGKYKAFIALPG